MPIPKEFPTQNGSKREKFMHEKKSSTSVFTDLFSKAVVGFRKVAIPLWTSINLGSGQPRVLIYLRDNDGCNQKEIGHNCKVEGATITGMLESMESKGLVSRTIPDDNKRAKKVYLTPAGRDKLMEVYAAFDMLNVKCAKGFTEEELIEFERLLKKLIQNLYS